MNTTVPPIPAGHHTVGPYLAIKDAARAIDYYLRAFGATEKVRLIDPAGTVLHAELILGDAIINLAEAPNDDDLVSPHDRPTTVRISLHVPDVDALVANAVAAGATLTRPVADQYYGERTGVFTDPFGHSWIVSTQIEVVSAAEMQRRTLALFA